MLLNILKRNSGTLATILVIAIGYINLSYGPDWALERQFWRDYRQVIYEMNFAVQLLNEIDSVLITPYGYAERVPMLSDQLNECWKAGSSIPLPLDPHLVLEKDTEKWIECSMGLLANGKIIMDRYLLLCESSAAQPELHDKYYKRVKQAAYKQYCLYASLQSATFRINKAAEKYHSQINPLLPAEECWWWQFVDIPKNSR